MKTFIRKEMNGLLAMTIGIVLTVFGISEGWAQQKRTISYKTLGAHSQYTQQYRIDVGDVPGHQIRIYELKRTFPTNPPTFEGVRVVEQWTRSFSDYIDINGRHWGYNLYVLENDDKIFSRIDGSSQTTVNPDGSRRSTATGVITLTGGTGKFRGIRGMVRYTTIFDPKAGLNKGEYDGEYWIE